MRYLQIFLLGLIIIGIGLLLSQKLWVPPLVSWMLSTEQSEAGKHCGGNIRGAYQCATGYHCAPTPGSHLPVGDVGGVCVSN